MMDVDKGGGIRFEQRVEESTHGESGDVLYNGRGNTTVAGPDRIAE